MEETILINEHSRLNTRLDILIDNSISDFKIPSIIALLSIFFGLFSKYKIVNFELNDEFRIFFAVLPSMIIALMGLRDLIKAYNIKYYIFQIMLIEKEIQKSFEIKKDNGEFTPFNGMKLWVNLFAPTVNPIFYVFLLFFVFFAVAPIILLDGPEKLYFLGWIIIISSTFFLFRRKLDSKVKKISKSI